MTPRIIIIGDNWPWMKMPRFWNAFDVLDEDQQISLRNNPVMLGEFLYNTMILERLETAFGPTIAQQIAYTPAARCSFEGGDAPDSAVFRCSAFTRNSIPTAKMLVLGFQGFQQLKIPLEFEPGRLVSSERWGIILMFDKLHKLFTSPDLISKFLRGAKAIDVK